MYQSSSLSSSSSCKCIQLFKTVSRQKQRCASILLLIIMQIYSTVLDGVQKNLCASIIIIIIFIIMQIYSNVLDGIQRKSCASIIIIIIIIIIITTTITTTTIIIIKTTTTKQQSYAPSLTVSPARKNRAVFRFYTISI